MPKKLNISSNERVDLEDFNRASTGYTQESDNFDRQKLLLSGRSLVSSGLRIEISDQATSPGEFTIYNGVAVDKSGNLLNNEQQVADARTLTLSGAGLEFYVEVEYVESESDVDSRAFWDPTFAGNTPAGKEFSLNVATRLTPDWQVVQPVSTSDFDIVTTGASSTKIPVAVLTTNGSNEITGFTAVNASTTLEEDALGATDGPVATLRVVDSTIFPTTGTFTVGGTSVNVTSNDRVNGLLGISPSLAVDKLAGAVVVEAGGATAAFVPQSDEASPPTGSVGDADRRRRLFAGDATRGSAMSSDPEDAALRSDVNVASLKDYVDFLSSQIRELKFGSQREDVEGGVPPSSWANTRYYDAAGSVAGARTATVTIGDGANSYGDVVGSELSTALQAAHDSLDATTGGSIYVKSGDYTWNGTVTADRPMSLIFDLGATFVAGTYSGELETDNASELSIFKAPARSDFRLDVITSSSNSVGANFTFTDCEIGRVEIDATTPADSVSIVGIATAFSTISTTANQHTISFPADATGRASSLRFDNCSFTFNNVANGSSYLVYGNISNATFNDCTFDAAVTTGSCDGFVYTDIVASASSSNWKFKGCSFVDTDTAEVTRAITIDALVDLTDVVFEDCIFDFNYAAVPASIYLLHLNAPNGEVDNCRIENCDFEPMGTNAINNTSAGTRGRIISIVGTDSSASTISSNYVIGCTFGIPVTEGTAVGETPNDFVTSIYNRTGGAKLWVRDCSFQTVGYSIYNDVDSNRMTVENCYFNICPGAAISFGQEVRGITQADTNTNIPVVVKNCRMSLGTNQSVNSSPSIGISAFAAEVSGCEIEVEFKGATNKAIDLYTTLTLSTNGIIHDNKITAGSNTSTAGLVVGIDCGGTSSVSDYENFYVANNVIRVATGSSGDDIYGIRVETDAESDDGPGTQITGNKIQQVVNSASANMTNCFGIYAEIGAGNISNNTVSVGEGGQTGITASPNGIYVIGNNVNVNDNNVNIDPFSNITNGRCIWVDGVNDPGSFFIHPGTINICNNICTNRVEVEPLILLNLGADDDDVAAINIQGNNCSTYGVSTCFFVYINVDAGVDSPGAFNVSNNIIREINAPLAVDRRAIYIDGQGAVSDAKGVVCSNNLILGANTSSLRSVSTNAAAISIDGGLGVVCNGNVVRGWVGSAIANRKSIVIDDATDVVCVGNSTEYSGSAGLENILINSCTGVNISANMCNTGSFATTGSTDVVSTGANNT